MAGGTILAMGGGGFSMEPRNPLLDEYVLSRARGRKPRICFLGTASGDSAAYVARFHRTSP
jgi:dipeptidase E